MYPELVERVMNFLGEALNKYPCEVDRDGDITYANGNDGTDFDWNVNDRLCEFGWGVSDGSVWAFKCLVNKNGVAEIYCYPHGEFESIDIIVKQLFTEREASQLCRLMYDAADRKGIYDVGLSELVWD